MIQRRTYHFSGQVQGVGFRYTAEHLARRFDVRGYVRNLPDGRVELLVEGAGDQMDQFVAAIHSEMGGLIKDTACTAGPATGEFTTFGIKR